MKRDINKSQFCDAFHQMGRGNQFSYEALDIIYDFLVEYEQDSGEEMELDVVSICCDICEMTPEDVISSYSYETTKGIDDVAERLSEDTMVLGTTKSTIIFHTF